MAVSTTPEFWAAVVVGMDFSCGIPVSVIVSRAAMPWWWLLHLPQSANFYQKKGVGASSDIG
jgi:hypothetical protein